MWHLVPSRAMRGFAIALLLVLTGTVPLVTAHANCATQSFDLDWRFALADPAGAEKADFDDAPWRALRVPHDWSIEGPFDQKNLTGPAGASLPSGVGWYRKHFTLPSTDSGRRVFIEFDGVMANSDVWINGFHLGKRPYGYVSFRYDLSGHLNFGEKLNVLAVRVDNAPQPASRWYSGAGIYRHVRMVVTDPVHLDYNSAFVSTPLISEKDVTLRVQATVVNDSDADQEMTVMATMHGPPGSAPDGAYAFFGESPAQKLAPHKSLDVSFEVPAPFPLRRWDIDQPTTLHTTNIRIRSSGKTIDEQVVTFGVRTAEFKADTGFWLNGKNVKLKGVCLHGDAGGLGVAVPMRAWERRLQLLKDVGCNAIRTAHNPPDPTFLDLCDRMGFVVWMRCSTAGRLRKTSTTITCSSTSGPRSTRVTRCAATAIIPVSSCGARATKFTTRPRRNLPARFSVR